MAPWYWSDFTTVTLEQVEIWLSLMDGLLTGWVGVPVRRGFMTLPADRSPPAGLEQPSVHRGCWAFLPAFLWLSCCVCPLSWSLQQWRSRWTECEAHVSSARMDLPGYHPQQPQPLVHHPGNFPEDLLTLEGSSTCECKIDSQKIPLNGTIWIFTVV